MGTKTKKVSSFSDLQKLIANLAALDKTQPFTVTTTDAEGTRDVVTVSGNEGSNIQHKILIEGFNALKSMVAFRDGVNSEEQADAEYGGFFPSSLDEECKMDFIDRFVTRNLDGQIEGLKITWNLPEGKFQLDPWSLQLTRA